MKILSCGLFKAPYETAHSTRICALNSQIWTEMCCRQQWRGSSDLLFDFYGGLIATARNTVLKTVGTASTRMGIDTSALRHLPVSSGALASPVNNYSIDIGSSRARTYGSERYPVAKASL